MDGGRPSGDARGTPPAGDSQGTRATDPPGTRGWSNFWGMFDRSGVEGLAGRVRQHVGLPPAMDRKDHVTEEGDLPRDPPGTRGWSNFWGMFDRSGVEGLAGRVRQHVGLPPAMDRKDHVTEEGDLPRFSLYHNIAHGPSLTKWEEDKLLQQLEVLLKQVQTYVDTMDLPHVEIGDGETLDLSPVQIGDGESVPVISSRFDPRLGLLKSYAEILSGLKKLPDSSFPRHGFSESMAPASKSETQLSGKEEENKKLVNAVGAFSAELKTLIAVGVQTSHVSSQFAQKVYLLVDRLDKKFKVIVKSSSHCYSFDGLVSKLKMPESVKTIYDHLTFYAFILSNVMTVADCIMDNFRTSPCTFNSIRKESYNLLTEDFSFEKPKLKSEPCKELNFAAGCYKGGDETIKLFMVKLKSSDKSVYISLKSVDGAGNAGNANANDGANGIGFVDNDVCLTKISVDKLYGEDLKCVIKVPYPSFYAKIGLVGKKPYLSYSGDVVNQRVQDGEIWVNQYPKLNMSAVTGVKSGGVGWQISFDTQQILFRYALGINMRTNLSAVGLTFKQGGTFRAYACKKLVDSTTTIAGQASYSQEAGADQGLRLTLGMKHSIDPELYVKAKAGTQGVSVAVKKSWSAPKCSVKAAAHLDFMEWRPKFGVFFSFRE